MPDYLQNRIEFCEGRQTVFSSTDSICCKFSFPLAFGPITSMVNIMRYLQPCEVAQVVHLLQDGSSVRLHDDVIKWKHFPRYWSFVRGIHRSPVNSPQKGQWRGALMFSLICTRINGWVNNGEAGDLRRYRPQYDVTVMGRMKVRGITKCYLSCLAEISRDWPVL